MDKYDIYIKSLENYDATVRLVMELYGVKLSDARTIVDAGLAGASVPEEYVDTIVERMSEIGVVTFITESEYDGDEDDDEDDEDDDEIIEEIIEEAPTPSKRKFNVPGLIAFILNLVNMVLFFVGLSTGYTELCSICTFICLPVFVLGIIGLVLVRKGRGRKVFPLVAFLVNFGMFIFSLIGASGMAG